MNLIKKIIVKLKIKKILININNYSLFTIETNYLKGLTNCNDKKIKELVNNTLKQIDEHNEIVNQCSLKLNSLNLDLKEIIQAPIHYDINEYNNLYNNLKLFKISDVVIKQKINKIKEIIDKYDNIKEQYLLYIYLSDLYESKKNHYIDQQEAIDVVNKIDNCFKKINLKNEYYDFALFHNFKQTIDILNNNFINTNLKDCIFDNVNNLSLDDEQRKSILQDDVSNLVIAGAGSGKTLTICGKIKYLLEKQNINPDEILVLSYSKSSSEDLNKKIININPNIKVKTFHSLGLEIIQSSLNKKQTIDDQYDHIVEEYFSKGLYEKRGLSKTIMIYYSLYLTPIDEDEHFEELYEYFESLKQKKLITLKKEKVKSVQELMIANYYFINGINYEYEASYKIDTSTDEKRQYTPDFKLTDFEDLYHEHYGIDEEGNTPQFSKEEEKEYINGMIWKRSVHEKYETKCIETYSYQFSDGTIFDNLDKELEQYGIVKKPITFKDFMNTLASNYDGNNFSSLIRLIKTFINLYKTKYANNSYFDELKNQVFSSTYQKNRTSYFIDICKDVYNYYYEKLKSENKIDFDNMIYDAIDYLSDLNNFKYKYIIVDEFQDISVSRMRLLKALTYHGSSKLFVVGDDWQAIYRFSGCDINIFLNFDKYFPMASISYITKTYRNSYELQKIVEPFITANPAQIKKNLRSDIHLNNPVIIFYYDKDKTLTLYEIFKEIYKEKSDASILLLGRNNKDLDKINKMTYSKKDGKLIFLSYETFNVTFKTVHSSKGLEDEYVILLNADDCTNGFPNKIEDDRVLNLVLSEKDEYKFSEERRLFYVALTRTKSKCYIIVDAHRPSIFVKEIIDNCIIGNESKFPIEKKYHCPKCKGKTLVLKRGDKRNFYCCTNYPYCDYITSNTRMVENQIICPKCGHYMVRRQNTRDGSYFYGCSNYPNCTFTRRFN